MRKMQFFFLTYQSSSRQIAMRESMIHRDRERRVSLTLSRRITVSRSNRKEFLFLYRSFSFPLSARHPFFQSSILIQVLRLYYIIFIIHSIIRIDHYSQTRPSRGYYLKKEKRKREKRNARSLLFLFLRTFQRNRKIEKGQTKRTILEIVQFPEKRVIPKTWIEPNKEICHSPSKCRRKSFEQNFHSRKTRKFA